MINTNCVIRNTNVFMNWNQIVNNCRAIRRNVIVLFKFAFSKLSIFIASETLVVVMVSWTENKDHLPTRSCDQRTAGRSQDEVPLSGELQYRLPAPPQTSDIRRNHWPLARYQWTSMEVCTCPICMKSSVSFCIPFLAVFPIMNTFILISILKSLSLKW